MLFLISHYTSLTSDQFRCVVFSYCYVCCTVQCGVVCDLICVISGLLSMPARHTTYHFICLWLQNIPIITLRCTKRGVVHSLPSTWFGYTNWCVWCLVCITCQPEIIHVVCYTSCYALLHNRSPVEMLLQESNLHPFLVSVLFHQNLMPSMPRSMTSSCLAFQSKILGDYYAQWVSNYNNYFPYAGMPSCRSIPLHARACRFIFSQKY